jgi:hypothetical protein
MSNFSLSFALAVLKTLMNNQKNIKITLRWANMGRVKFGAKIENLFV